MELDTVWITFEYIFDPYFQQEDLGISFLETKPKYIESMCLSKVNKEDKLNGIHISANSHSLSMNQISKEDYELAVDEGEISEDPWPNFGIETFFSWHHLWRLYEKYLDGSLDQNDLFNTESCDKEEDEYEEN